MAKPVDWQLNAKVPPSVFRRCAEFNSELGLEQIEQGEPKTGKLYIACSGPSLADTWQELKTRDGEIWALNGAYDWLCRKGIRPDYGVCLAPENQILKYFLEIQEGDKFLFGSQTHTELVLRAILRGANVKLWQVAQPEEWGLPILKDTPLVYGGGTVGTRAIDLAYILGWRDVHILGMDCCLSETGYWAPDHPVHDDVRPRLQTFLINGRAFVAMPSHARQVEDFSSILRPLTGLNVTLYGDGMLQWSQYKEEAA